MKQFLSIFCVFSLLLQSGGLAFGQPDTLQYQEKTLFGTITNPRTGEVITISNDVEDAALLDKIENNGSSTQHEFTVEGVAGPETNVSVWITTPIPEDISNFEATVNPESITFSWTPRDVFLSETHGITNVDSTANVGDSSNVPRLDELAPLSVHKRNETTTLDYTDTSHEKDPWTEPRDCQYVKREIQDGRCVIVETQTISGNCEYTPNYEYFWQSPFEGEERLPDSPHDYQLPFTKGIYEFIYWMKENVTGEFIPDPVARNLSKNLIAEAQTVKDWIGVPRLLAFSAGNKEDKPPVPGPPPPGTCFLAGTQITMEDGSLKAIEDIQVGDDVLSFSPETGRFSAEKVLELESPLSPDYYEVNFSDGSELQVTAEHPIYTKNGWASIFPKETGDFLGMSVHTLSVGNSVLTQNGQWKEVINIIQKAKEVQTYNLKNISNTHTFFAEKTLVHNKGGGAGTCEDSPCTPQCPAWPKEKYALHNEYKLVDDFERYEIWYNVEGDTQRPYLYQLGVARDPDISHKIEFSSYPEMSGVDRISIDVPFALITDDDGLAFSPGNGKKYHFTLFEVQQIEVLNTEGGVVPVDVEGAFNDAGYLYTATNSEGGLEIEIQNGNVSYPPLSTPKMEVELRNRQVLSDNNGEFVIPNISLLTLNPAALIHSIIALYNASDTRFSETQEDNAFSILSLRDASFFKTQGISLVPPLLNIQTEPYGTVYDSCTKEPIPNVKISCEGTAVSKQGTVNDFRLTQNTGSDGFFSFYATPGKYTLNVESIHDGEDGNFIFPSRALSGQCETMRRNGDGIYSDVYCEDPLETIIIADKILHFDVPVDPTICGTADPDETVYLVRNDTGEIADQTTATPNGKFSFFVTNPNQYTVTTDTE